MRVTDIVCRPGLPSHHLVNAWSPELERSGFKLAHYNSKWELSARIRMWLVRMMETLESLMEELSVLLHFPSPRSSLNEWICSEGLLPTKEDDILKQSQAFLSIRWLSASSCSDSWPLTMPVETAIFVKSHLKKWLFSLPTWRGVNKLLELSKSSHTQ